MQPEHFQATPPPHPLEMVPEHHETPGTCWLKTRFRNIGQMVSECSAGLEKANNLCYPECKEGFEGVVESCWSKCPPGFKSNGSFCQKPKALGRGWGSQRKCQDCEKYGLLWYKVCPEGYHSVGGLLCSADCPLGMFDAGNEQCAKKSYSRQNPHPMVCPPGKEQEGFLCFDPCSEGQMGSHNVCWGQCPVGTEQCGVLCLQSGEQCTAYIASIGKDTLSSILAQ